MFENGVIIVFLFFMFLAVTYFWNMKRNRQLLASIVTVLGILGTFVGIAYGLYMFDEKNIQQSIPNLLGGLKVAFVTSIAGIFLSILIKLQAAYKQKQLDKTETHKSEGATVDDLNNNLLIISDLLKEDSNITTQRLENIERALSGEGETTVVTQLQKIRTTFSDKQDDLLKAFNEFAENMAENNSKALIEALKEVIRDFNAKINEQFGENFKQLNQAVEKILVWQNQYMKQMDELANQFKIAAESIEKSRESLKIISENCDSIKENSEKLEPILNAFEERQKSLAQHLEAFKDLREKAGEAFPIIKDRLDQLTGQFSEHVNEAILKSKESTDNFTKHLHSQSSQMEEILNNIKNNNENIMAQTSRNIDKFFQDTSARFENQLVNLDNELSNELTKSLSSLGSQLTSLSGKFVEDYTPLTDKLKDVVRIAQGIQHG